jgi:hypothetical protein
MLSIVLMAVVLLGFNYSTNDLGRAGHFVARELLPTERTPKHESKVALPKNLARSRARVRFPFCRSSFQI